MLEYVGIIYNKQNKTRGTRIARGRGRITVYELCGSYTTRYVRYIKKAVEHL